MEGWRREEEGRYRDDDIFLVYRLTKELERCNRINEIKLAVMQRK